MPPVGITAVPQPIAADSLTNELTDAAAATFLNAAASADTSVASEWEFERMRKYAAEYYGDDKPRFSVVVGADQILDCFAIKRRPAFMARTDVGMSP